MPAKKEDDALKATHYRTNHAVGAFARGELVTTEALHRSFGRDRDATPEEHEAYRKSSLRRLLDLGAISPAEAPEEPEEEAAAPAAQSAPSAPAASSAPEPPKSTERQTQEEEAAARRARAESPKK